MARIDTAVESNGPDRFNLNPNCAQHHAGVRTGISDYCCCCDPCAYVRKNESASQPEDRMCCRCLPRLILAKFTATNGNDCCRNVVVPMLASVETVDGQDVIAYTGSIVGYEVTVYLSSSPVSGYGDAYDFACRWTISIPYLGIFQEIEIDHTVVTCLGVPAISVTNVPALNGCVGTISLINYTTVKVPFHVRYSIPPDESETITVPFPDGYACEGCDSLPRYICVSKKHNRINRIRSPRIPWEIEWARDFRWDEAFEPTFNEYQQEYIVGRWTWTPEDTTEFHQRLYLIQDLYGACFLQPDFVEPAGTDGDGEEFQRVPLSSCGCDFKILNVRPIDDPAPPEVPGESLPEDLTGIDYRGGRCGCWEYHCGKRRCVPKYLCGFLFVGNTLYRNILFTWSNDVKCWVSSSGVGLDGYPMPFDLRVCLEKSAAGECQMVVSYEDYDLNTVAIGDTDTVLSGTFEGKNYAGDDYFSLNVDTSFDGDCELLITCVTATPCVADCGSHPATLHLRLHGYSLPTDYPPPPVTGECTTEITLGYHQTVVVSGSGILFTCGYVGWKLVESYYLDPVTMIAGTAVFLIKAELSLGSLRITRRLATDPTTVLQTETVLLDESCNPYYGYKLTDASLKSCFFGDSSIVWHHWEAEVTE